jgi:hypothetical protein
METTFQAGYSEIPGNAATFLLQIFVFFFLLLLGLGNAVLRFLTPFFIPQRTTTSGQTFINLKSIAL